MLEGGLGTVLADLMGDLKGCLLLFKSRGLSYLHVIAGLVLFLGHVKRQNSERLICEIALQQISLHLLLSVQVISQ